MTDSMDQALGWDDEVEGGDGEFEPVPAGDYSFRVVSMERQYHNGSEKMGPCPVARIEIELTDAPRAAHVFDRLFLNKKVMWKIVGFFTAIGLHAKGDESAFKPDWTRVVGRTGRCRIKTREYNGKTYNDVDRWIAQEEGAAPATRPAAYVPPASAPVPAAVQQQIDQTFRAAQQAQPQQQRMTPGAF